MAIWYLGSARYRETMVEAAAALTPPVIIEPGNSAQIYPQSETYVRIVTADVTLPNPAVGSPEWHLRMDAIAAPPLSITITEPLDGSSPPSATDLDIRATVVGGWPTYNTVFTYDGTGVGNSPGLQPSVTVPGASVIAGTVDITATVTDGNGDTAVATITTNPVLLINLVEGTEPVGPISAYGLLYWLRLMEGVSQIGLNVGDSDPEPDVWFTWEQLPSDADISEEQSIAIRQQLDAVGFS